MAEVMITEIRLVRDWADDIAYTWVEVDNPREGELPLQCHEKRGSVETDIWAEGPRITQYDASSANQMFESISGIYDEHRKALLTARKARLLAEHTNCDIDPQNGYWHCHHHNLFNVPW